MSIKHEHKNIHAASYSMWHEIINGDWYDSYADEARANGYDEAYAMLISIDGEQFKFRTMADFRAALAAGQAGDSSNG